MFHLPSPPSPASTVGEVLSATTPAIMVDRYGRKIGDAREVPVLLVCQAIVQYEGRLYELLGRIGHENGKHRVALRLAYGADLVVADLAGDHLVALRQVLSNTYAPLPSSTEGEKWDGNNRREDDGDNEPDIRYS